MLRNTSAVHGEHSGFAHNIAADPRVRLNDADGGEREPRSSRNPTRRGVYARSGLRALAEDPKTLRIDFDEGRVSAPRHRWRFEIVVSAVGVAGLAARP